jgi:hypothetical protein
LREAHGNLREAHGNLREAHGNREAHDDTELMEGCVLL